MELLNFSYKHLFSINCSLETPPEPIGVTPEGLRVNFYFKGGEVYGPRINGILKPNGQDRMLVRHDGIAQIDVRATIQTDDGAQIMVDHQGIVDLGEDGYKRTLDRSLGNHATARVSASYMTGHDNYLWLNRLQCFGILDIDRATFKLRYDIYAFD